MKKLLVFIALGLFFAAPGEILNQILARQDLRAFRSTMTSYVVLLAIGFFVEHRIRSLFAPNKFRARLIYYFFFGFLGLMVEWFLLGNAPVLEPFQIITQPGMFTYWGTLLLGPCLIADAAFARRRKAFVAFFASFSAIYLLLALLLPRDKGGIFLGFVVFATGTTALNYFYFSYFKGLAELQQRTEERPITGRNCESTETKEKGQQQISKTAEATSSASPTKPKTFRRRVLQGFALGCGGMLLVGAVLIVFLFLFLNQVPKRYPPTTNPIEPPSRSQFAPLGLDGFESPYLGHTGSWDGKGGNMWGGSKVPELDKEVGMGLRWTFMPVNWRAMEPDGPVDLNHEIPAAWKSLDAFLMAAHERHLNVLMQAPVVGGNAGGPPAWAGRREQGKSAPLKMEALAEFAGKLAERYRPGGTLAQREGWGNRYGIRAWELDNEPEMYRTHWKDQAGDYAEFASLAAARIKAADPQAIIVGPALASGKQGLRWLETALDAGAQAGSPAFGAQAKSYSIGPVLDVVSFHDYEGLDSAFTKEPRTIGQVFEDVRAVFEKWENKAPGFTYHRKQDYWHTEGNFDFIGALSAERRASWRMQFFTRAFAAGVRKVCVMDASARERIAVRAYVRALPWPFPMGPADSEVKVLHGRGMCFRHQDGDTPEAGQVWVLWAVADTGIAQVEIPVIHKRVTLIQVDGTRIEQDTLGNRLIIELKGDSKMAAPILVLDRPQRDSTPDN